ncbi:MAG: hypothetical protein M3157_07390, partial [Actinomycetota bacterium]|nr:hypothetical protein [Actinomycetota bacterium]
GGRLGAQLPPSLMTMFRPHESEVASAFGLMGRALDVGALATALEPAWIRQLQSSGHRGGSLHVSGAAGRAEMRVDGSGVEVESRASQACALGEGEFAHLLFRGFDETAAGRLGDRPDSDLLRVLFPEQDFVVWRADAF